MSSAVTSTITTSNPASISNTIHFRAPDLPISTKDDIADLANKIRELTTDSQLLSDAFDAALAISASLDEIVSDQLEKAVQCYGDLCWEARSVATSVEVNSLDEFISNMESIESKSHEEIRRTLEWMAENLPFDSGVSGMDDLINDNILALSLCSRFVDETLAPNLVIGGGQHEPNQFRTVLKDIGSQLSSLQSKLKVFDEVSQVVKSSTAGHAAFFGSADASWAQGTQAVEASCVQFGDLALAVKTFASC